MRNCSFLEKKSALNLIQAFSNLLPSFTEKNFRGIIIVKQSKSIGEIKGGEEQDYEKDT